MIRPGISKSGQAGKLEPRIIDVSLSQLLHASTTAAPGLAAGGGAAGPNFFGAAQTQGTQTGSSSGHFTVNEALCMFMTAGVAAVDAEQLRRFISGYKPAPYLDPDTAPVAVSPGRGAYRLIMQLAWNQVRQQSTNECASGMELVPDTTDNYESPVRAGIGIAIVQQGGGLDFLSTRGGGVPAILTQILDEVISQRVYTLEFRIESARRNTPAILTVLVDDVVKLRESWADGRLPVPSDRSAGSAWRWAWCIASATEGAQSGYLLDARFMAAAEMGHLI